METETVKVGSVMMGGSWPVSIQTMWKEPLPAFSGTSDPRLAETAARIKQLHEIGCDILRFAIPDERSVESLGLLAAMSPIPLVADIHFDWRLALKCLDFPIAKIRINPGNIGARWKVEEVVRKAKDKDVPIRIGVNAGSLPEDLRSNEDTAHACILAAEREIEVLEELDYHTIVVSMKLNEPAEVLRANRDFASKFSYPLHLGVTEAGPLISGVVRNTAALVPLLQENIGATIRISLSDSMEAEVLAGREILACAGARNAGARIVSCPRCGRASFDTHAFLARWSERLYRIQKPITIAVMGCVVNGPGEAKNADIGITGAGDYVLIFRKDREPLKIKPAEADMAFSQALESIINE